MNARESRSTKLVVTDLCKNFENRAVLRGLEFAIAAPGCLAITGPNGSGKTTLMKTLAGLQRPSRGSVRFELGADSLDPIDQQGMFTLISPELSLYDTLTGHENLRFFSRVLGLRFNASRQDELLQEVGLAGRGHDRVAVYSSGMKQRLKYALAWLADSVVLLLDEPTANLDENGKEMAARLIATRKQDRLVIIATNEKDDLRHADEIVNLAG
ncbi:MAG: ABC transporter ATP-binding protein [bacterium]